MKKKIKYSFPPFQLAGTKKKIVKPASACHDLTCVREGFISAVSNGGNEENEKKNDQK